AAPAFPRAAAGAGPSASPGLAATHASIPARPRRASGPAHRVVVHHGRSLLGGTRLRLPAHVLPLQGRCHRGHGFQVCRAPADLRACGDDGRARQAAAARPADRARGLRRGAGRDRGHPRAAARLVAGARQRWQLHGPPPQPGVRAGPALLTHATAAAARPGRPLAQGAAAGAGQLLLQRAAAHRGRQHCAAGPPVPNPGQSLAGSRVERGPAAPGRGGLGLDRHEPGRRQRAHRVP
ncbi:MAG: AttH component of AttEFGH ABC transport system, partial [uncultured Ramlibacter sp.]